MNILKMAVGLVALGALARVAGAVSRDGFFDAEQLDQLHGNVIFVSNRVSAKPKPQRAPAPPPPPAARCPVDAPAGKGQLAWDDLKESFYGNNTITEEKTFQEAFAGQWIKVGETRSRHHWGVYDPEGLHADPTGCYSGWCENNGFPRSGWIGTYQNTAGPLGAPHYGIQLVNFDRLHKVKGMNSSYPLKFEDGGVVTDRNTWSHDTQRAIRIVAPANGQKAAIAVMEEARLDDHGDKFDKDFGPEDAYAYVEYCKISD